MEHLQLPSASQWPEEDSAPRTTPLQFMGKAKINAKKSWGPVFHNGVPRRATVGITWACICSGFWYLQGSGTSELFSWIACSGRIPGPSPKAPHVPIPEHELIVFLMWMFGFLSSSTAFWNALIWRSICNTFSPGQYSQIPLCSGVLIDVSWVHDQKCSFSNFTSFLFTNDRSSLSANPPSNPWFLLLGHC